MRSFIDARSQEHGASHNINAAWLALPPDEREKYHAMSKPYLDELKAEIIDYNNRIPLSPSVPSEVGSNDSEDEYVLEERRGAQLWNRYRRDHPKACGGAMTPIPDKPFPFSNLPTELRRKIYGFAVGEGLRLQHKEADGSADEVQGPIDVRLFAVNKMMREEAMVSFLENHVFVIDVGDDGIVGALPLFIRETAAGRKRWPVEKMKRADVTVSIQKSIQVSFLGPLLHRVCNVLADCTQLAEVSITPTCPMRSHSSALDADMDALLDSFSRVRGVSNVHWTTDPFELRERYEMYNDCVVGNEDQRARLGQIMMSRV
jgi:hypothetical protein